MDEDQDLFEQSSLLYNMKTGIISITKTQYGPHISILSDILTAFKNENESPLFINFLPVTNSRSIEKLNEMTEVKRVEIRLSRDMIKNSQDPYIQKLKNWDTSLDPDYIDVVYVNKTPCSFSSNLKNKILALINHAPKIKVDGINSGISEHLDLVKDRMIENLSYEIIDRNVSHDTRIFILQQAYNNNREIFEKRFS